MEHTPHTHDGVAAVSRPAAVRGPAPRFNVDPGKALVTDRHLQAGGFGYDRRVSRPLPNERVRPDALVLLVHHRRDDEPALFEATLRRDPRRVDHRGQSAFHILRTAAIETIVAYIGR